MKTEMIALVVLVIIVIVVAVAYIGYSGKSAGTTVYSTTLNSNSSLATTSVVGSTTAPTTTVVQVAIQNGTLNSTQVISALGTGFTAAAQYNYGPSNLTTTNGTTESVQGYGVATFGNGGQLLATEWIHFNSAAAATSYANATFQSTFPNATNVTRGTQGNATFIFYSGDAINKGQAASVVYASDGAYGMVIFNQGTAFPLATAKTLLAAQMASLKIS